MRFVGAQGQQTVGCDVFRCGQTIRGVILGNCNRVTRAGCGFLPWCRVNGAGDNIAMFYTGRVERCTQLFIFNALCRAARKPPVHKLESLIGQLPQRRISAKHYFVVMGQIRRPTSMLGYFFGSRPRRSDSNVLTFFSKNVSFVPYSHRNPFSTQFRHRGFPSSPTIDVSQYRTVAGLRQWAQRLAYIFGVLIGNVDTRFCTFFVVKRLASPAFLGVPSTLDRFFPG